jgi:hypothetical protein
LVIPSFAQETLKWLNQKSTITSCQLALAVNRTDEFLSLNLFQNRPRVDFSGARRRMFPSRNSSGAMRPLMADVVDLFRMQLTVEICRNAQLDDSLHIARPGTKRRPVQQVRNFEVAAAGAAAATALRLPMTANAKNKKYRNNAFSHRVPPQDAVIGIPLS